MQDFLNENSYLYRIILLKECSVWGIIIAVSFQRFSDGIL